jgi:hypothetical protein
MMARWVMDLSPGTVIMPLSGPRGVMVNEAM